MEQLSFTPKVQAHLDEFFSRPHPAGTVATFDLDGTCVHHDTGEALLHSMAESGDLDLQAILDSPEIWRLLDEYRAVSDPRPAIMAAIKDPTLKPACAKAIIAAYWQLLAQAGMSVASSCAAFLLAGKTIDEVRSLSRKVIMSEIERPLATQAIKGYSGDPSPLFVPAGLRSYQPMRDLVRHLKETGIECWIVSGTNRWTVEVYSEMFLGIPDNRILGITPRVRGNCIQGETDPDYPITVGAGKVAAIDRFIGRKPIFAAGDSTGDWEMLMAASEFCLVIDKGDTEMRRRISARGHSGERKWAIQPRFIDPPRPAGSITGECHP
jgi:phosphoserine phosphatase